MLNAESDLSGKRSPKGNHPTAGPHSPEQEARLCQHLEGALSKSESMQMELHLADCPECQQLSREWKELDLRLERGLRRPQLRPGFSERLWHKIENHSQRSAAGIAPEHRQQREAELKAWWGKQQRDFWRQQRALFLNLVGFSSSTGLALYYVVHLLLAQAGTSVESMLLLAVVVGAAVLCAGFAVGRARQQALPWALSA